MQKDIRYNKFNKDYDMFLDGRYVGSRASHKGAEEELDRLAFDQMTHPIDDERREFLNKLYSLNRRAA